MAKKDEDYTPSLDLIGGTNLTKLKKDAGKLYQEIKKLKAKRQEINDQLSAHRENLKAMGIPRSAQSEVERRAALADAEKRREHDMGVQVYGEAVGVPFDIFESADKRSDENPRSEPRKASERKKAPAKKAGPKVVKNAKGVPEGEAVDLTGASRPLAGLDKAIENAERASGKLN